MLEEAGIRAHVRNEHLSSLAGEIPFNQVLPEVWLANARDVDAARVILDAYLARRVSPDGPQRHCRSCGEDSPSNFEVCWKCRRPF
jgi:hypothetical protein